MPDFLRDPIWQFVGVLVGCTCGLIPILLSIVFFVAQQYKSLAYEILAETDLVTVKDELKDKLQILFEKVTVRNVSLLIIKIVNNGSVPIASTDFERPLKLLFKESSRVLDAQTVEVKPDSLRPQLGHQENQITLEPLLLNSGDYITIKAVVEQYQSPLEVTARIIGVKSINQILPTETNIEPMIPIAQIAATLAGIGLYQLVALGFLFAPPPPTELNIPPFLSIAPETIETIKAILLELPKYAAGTILCISGPILLIIGLIIYVDKKKYTPTKSGSRQ